MGIFELCTPVVLVGGNIDQGALQNESSNFAVSAEVSVASVSLYIIES